MKTYLGILLGVALLIGCVEKKPEKPVEIENAVAMIFNEGWNKGNVEVFGETIADSVLFHYAGSPKKYSLEQMSQIVLQWREAFPDLHMNIEGLVTEGNRAAARLTLTGTHEGTWAGADPTGKQVEMALMMFFRFEGGKMVELWESDDQLGFQQQLGLLP